ncbi:YjcZ family sporulation protein [Halalkalibacter krulwichiae]
MPTTGHCAQFAGGGFALIVVLFILLIIIGSTWVSPLD